MYVTKSSIESLRKIWYMSILVKILVGEEEVVCVGGILRPLWIRDLFSLSLSPQMTSSKSASFIDILYIIIRLRYNNSSLLDPLAISKHPSKLLVGPVGDSLYL